MKQFLLLAFIIMPLDARTEVTVGGMGYGAGDIVLKQVSQQLTNSIKKFDHVARVGGDEFTVVIPRIASPGDAAIVARKIVAALSIGFTLGEAGRSVSIGTSVGIALYPDQEQKISVDSAILTNPRSSCPASSAGQDWTTRSVTDAAPSRLIPDSR